MIAKHGKRALSLFLALIMIISAVPMQAFADDGHDHTDEVVASISELAESPADESETPEEESETPDEESETPDEESETPDEESETPDEESETPDEESESSDEESETPDEESEAPEEEPETPDEEDTDSDAGMASEAAIALAARINNILEVYGVTADMTDDEIRRAINAQPWSVNKPNITEIAEIVAIAEGVDGADAEYVLANADVETFVRFKDIFNAVNAMVKASSGTYEPVTGAKVAVSGASNTTHSNGVVTVTAKGSAGFLGMGASAKTATITVTNSSGSKAKISFDWTASSVNELKIDGTKYTGNGGSFEKVLDANGSFTITITTAKNATENKLVMKNFACEAVKDSSAVTFQYESSLGSITVAGAAVESGAQKDVPGSGETLVATAKNGATFVGWMDADTHTLMSQAATFTLEPVGDMTVKAVFTKNACFIVNGNALYEDLNAALEAVKAVSNKTIVLANSGILPSGSYTIPSGVTLSIPCDTTGVSVTSDYTTTPGIKDAEAKTEPTAYRKLTMADGAVLTVNGSLQIAGNQSCKQYYNGRPVGAVGWITMNGSSKIVVNGNLYAWGVVDGTGTVDLNSSATAYECFYITDWRGGSETSGMVGNSYGVFPMDQYTIPNVKVRMTIHSGAKEYGYMSVNVSLVGIQGASVPFINNSQGMFRITSGSITKWNDGRLHVEVNGNLNVATLKVGMKLGILGDTTIDSANYNLPINNMMSVTVKSGSVINVNQDLALLPGSELIVESGATATLGSGKKIIVYDADDFDGAAFVFNSGTTYANAPDAKVVIDGTADLSAGAAYTTSGGADISGNGTIIVNGKNATATKTYQRDQINEKYVEIAIQPGALHNADGNYVTTANDLGKVTYTSVNGNWSCAHTYAEGTYVEEITTAASCGKAGSKTIKCNCGEDSYTEETPALSHDYEEKVTAPTCTAAGFTTYTCKNCGDSYNGSEVAKLGHSYNAVVTAPTCENAGYTTHTCANCGDKYIDSDVAALGHTAGAAADCKNAQICTVCGAELNAALGHNYDAVVTEPTCTAAGYTTHTCANCGHVYTDSPVDALGHNYDAVVTEPTCTAAGYTTHTCANCGHVYTDSETTAAGHKWEWIIDKAATVLEPGVKHEECSACGASQNENTEIPVLVCSHEGTMTGTAAVDATCTEAGNSAYYYCEACHNYYSDEAGQHEIEKDSWIIPAAGHDEVEHEAQNATCTAIGWEAYVTCNNCDYTTYVEKPIDPDAHDKEFHGAQAPTCTEIGWETYVTCSRCDYTTYVEIPAAGHDEVEHEAQASTCTETGWEAYVTCSRCDYSTYEELPIDPDAHDEIEHEAQAPTCKAEGYDAYVTCSRCDYSTKGEPLPVDPEGHVWDEGEEYGNHSCNSPLRMKYTCTLCGEIEYEIIKEQHFRIPIAEEVPATCTTDGMTSGWKCEKCDEFWIPQEVIPALGHDWNGTYPCQSDESACTRCGLSFTTKQEHLVVVETGIPATCTTPGLSDGSYCGYCSEVLTEQVETPVAEHNWIYTDMEIPATCTTPGHKEGGKYCMDCDYDADAIPALSHEWMHRDAKKATYSAIGWNAHDYCLLCKAVKTLEEYETEPCEFCGENPEGYIEIPKVEVKQNATLDDFMTNIGYLEMMAEQYALEHPGTDPLGLVLNYMRTGVANYTTGSWAIMAGPENTDFLKYVQAAEDAINADPEIDVWVNVSGLKKLWAYSNTHGESSYYPDWKVTVMSGHFFGTMDMTYYNKGSQNHADVGGWVGDLTDLLSTSDEFGVPADLTLEEKVNYIRENYLFKNNLAGSAGAFGPADLYADLEAYYFMRELITKGYNSGDLERMFRAYYQPGLTLKQRVSYLLTNRLDGLSTRQDLRTAVYNAYTSNKLISTLEGTRNFNASGNELAELRKAVCYAFADEMCRIAGDYVEDLTNDRFTVFDSETKILAPGVSQQINYATNADGKQIVYYVATADVAREDVGLWVNYYDRNPGTPENPVWKNSSVLVSAQNAQNRFGDPENEDYIENFSVVASTNAGGYDMSDVATPGGLMVMDGVEWHPQSGTAGFFAILDDGTAYMGTHDEYESMMVAGRIKEAIGGFGEFVVQNGEVTGSATYSDAPRTSVGITATGRVVLMCIDGRQAPFSSGASLQDVGYIMKEAGCVVAINLDGGGSTTFVARQPGSDDLTIMNRPSDGYARNVSTNLLIYSTAPSSTKFDHAVIESEYDYATIGTPVQMTAAGVSPSGNAVDIPEGATWAVGDEDFATIDEDGVFTGKQWGEVTVYLMLDGKTVGSKIMTITTPDQLYFEKSKVDAIYGSSVTLPLRARIEGKPIAINAYDVNFTLSAPNAGTMNGFAFVAAESTVKTMTITADIGELSKASINVMLYQQGENSFDFDKATGGDRMLAWHREVTNAKVEDGNIYNVIDPSKDMVTSYTFALDMTALPIPERLEELTYMLPGGTMEGSNAWTFLTSLAQRISDLSWVKATIKVDDRFDVDYSELKVLNDYFTLKNVEFDESTNILVITMGWIKQSQVIDMATANPLCMINGLKLTPKDGVWEDTTKINVVTSGEIGYQIYMRASGLYSFAQKPESQAVFGVYPYRNPADSSDAGGYFYDTYAQISDEYTLVNVLKEGWVNEDGGFAYYVSGERMTGVQKIDGYYYDFGENGVNVGQTKLTGMFYADGAWYYSYIGELVNGWQSIGGDWYYFNPKNNQAVSGTYKINGVKFYFEENGKLTDGVWVKTLTGTRYYYGPTFYWNLWHEIDGEMYYFEEGYRVTGYNWVTYPENVSKYGYAYFDENGKYVNVGDGIFEIDGALYYFENGYSAANGLVCVDGDYYFAGSRGHLITNTVQYAYLTNCDLPCGRYEFGADGKMLQGIVDKNGTLYYYENGAAAANGLICVDGDYYFAGSGGRLIVDTVQYAYLTNCDLPCGRYEFGADGKMVKGIVDKDGTLYCYENGVAAESGLIYLDGDYYFVGGSGRLIVDTVQYAYATRCDLPCGRYEFGADGKMLRGIVDKNGTLYCYENGVVAASGLICLDGDYYFVGGSGRLIVDTVQYAYATRCDLPCGRYEFGADGKMLRGIVDKNGVLYYYENGAAVVKGLVCVDGDYYFAGGSGRILTDVVQYAYQTSCDMPCGRYEFGADGKMIGSSKTGEIVVKNGNMYYYEAGAAVAKGLVCLNGDYYFAGSNGLIVTNTVQYAYATSCDMPCGRYEFGADGKMIGSSKTGEIVVKDGTMYYYEDGAAVAKGLICLDGDYYFVGGSGRIFTNTVQYAYQTSCDLPCGSYEFDAEGKMIGSSKTGEIIVKNGTMYYYESGTVVAKGLIFLNGDYYFVGGGGRILTDTVQYAYLTNCNLPCGHYEFGADGKMIGSSASGEIVNKDGVLYYYENGARVNNKGLVYIDGYYYFVGANGRLAVNCRQNVWEANGLLIEGYYTFNELGQLIG